ncbi:MAG: GAF domain-containing sensor histidine kinase [Bacteroidota bacterium]|nr:GAF domain-containing sensor histidine kinase [Bacteroidota bacterium]
MKTPTIPSNESARLQAIYEYEILDTFTEEDYDSLTKIAAEICQTEISLISFVDSERQWFKSHYGLDASETPRDYSFCAHAINNPEEIFIVNDARLDERFADNPLVTEKPNVIFYAGMPLISESGFPMGTMCVIDPNPKQLSQGQIEALRGLSKQVINLLELRKSKIELEKTNLALKEQIARLETFAMIAAHDLKSPLKNISSIVDMVLEDHSGSIASDGQKMLGLLKKSSNKLLNLVDGMLAYCKSDRAIHDKKTEVNFYDLFEQLKELFAGSINVEITTQIKIETAVTNLTALSQIFINLISNAIKYNDKPTSKIEIGVEAVSGYLQFYVKDNGPGIDEQHHLKVFEAFQILSDKDRFGDRGNGLGLNTVKSLTQKLGGDVCIDSKFGEGTTFIFTIAK